MWRWIVIVVALLGCRNEPKRKITKHMTMTNITRCVDSDASCARSGIAETCTDGNETACARGGGQWNGKYCCMPKLMSCDAGNEEACARVGGTWTGAMCCLDRE